MIVCHSEIFTNSGVFNQVFQIGDHLLFSCDSAGIPLAWPEALDLFFVAERNPASRELEQIHGPWLEPTSIALTAFEASDLPRVMELYDCYCEGRDGTTLRSEEYWQGNLHYAEAPEQQFRLRESAGELSAYVRTGRLAGFDCLMEFAARPGCELELAALVVGRVPDGGTLIARLPRDSALEGALAEGGLELVELADRSPMWLVLDRARLASLAGVPPDVGDGELLAELGLHYWLADRF